MIRTRVCSLVVCSVLVAACTESVMSPAEEEVEISFSHGLRGVAPGEEQGVVDLTRGITYAILPEGAGQNLVQTFSPTRKERIFFLELPVGCAPGVLLNVRLRQGIGGPILFEGNAVVPGLVDGTFKTIQVANLVTSHGIKLKKKRTYAIELAAFPQAGAVEQTCGIAPGPVGDSYPRGQGFFEDVPTNGPGLLPLPDGLPTDQEDLPFRTLVR